MCNLTTQSYFYNFCYTCTITKQKRMLHLNLTNSRIHYTKRSKSSVNKITLHYVKRLSEFQHSNFGKNLIISCTCYKCFERNSLCVISPIIFCLYLCLVLQTSAFHPATLFLICCRLYSFILSTDPVTVRQLNGLTCQRRHIWQVEKIILFKNIFL